MAGAVRRVDGGDHRVVAVRVQQVGLPAHGELPAVGRHPQPVDRVDGDGRGVGAQGGVVLDPVQPQAPGVGIHFGRVSGGSGSVGAEQDGAQGVRAGHLHVRREVRDLRGLARGDGPDVGASGGAAAEAGGGGGPAGGVRQPAADVGVDGADLGLAEVHRAVVGVESHVAVLVPLVRGVDAGHAVHCHIDPGPVHMDVHGVAAPGVQRNCRGRRHILAGGQIEQPDPVQVRIDGGRVAAAGIGRAAEHQRTHGIGAAGVHGNLGRVARGAADALLADGRGILVRRSDGGLAAVGRPGPASADGHHVRHRAGAAAERDGPRPGNGPGGRCQHGRRQDGACGQGAKAERGRGKTCN